MKSLDDVARLISSVPLNRGKMIQAGTIEFKKDQGPIRRDIRSEGFIWSGEALRNLTKILWATQRAHSYGMTALRLFSRMPSSDFSPDGLLGGRGYIQEVKTMRSDLSKAVEAMSSFTDTLHDEVNGDHWVVSEDPVAQDLMESVDRVKSDPDQYVENEMESEVPIVGDEDDLPLNPSPEEMNPALDDESVGGDEDEGDDWGDDGTVQVSSLLDAESSLPTDNAEQEEARSLSELVMRTVLPESGNLAPRRAPKAASGYEDALDRYLTMRGHRASSSLPVDTLPGPRIDHIGPAAGNEAGHFNDEEEWSSDGFTGEGFTRSNPPYEDWAADGVSGYEDPTDGDSSVLKLSHELAGTYSLLPGNPNSKPMDLYSLEASEEEIERMEANSEPDVAGEDGESPSGGSWGPGDDLARSV